MVEPIYSIDKTCPICEKTFKVTRMRGRQILLKQDSDFCSWFKDVNPYYYSIWVCPHCNYASTEDHFEKIYPPTNEKLKKALQEYQEPHIDLCGERDAAQALASYEQAIFCCEAIGAPASRLAELYLKMSWICRQNERADDEKTFLEKASAKYDEALSRERLPIGNLSGLAVTYLIGDMSRRLGNLEKASLYFSKIISDPMAKMEPKILNITRDAWQEIRAAKTQPDKS